MITAPLVTYVEGKMDEMQLKGGELEKAKSWAQEVAKALSKWNPDIRHAMLQILEYHDVVFLI